MNVPAVPNERALLPELWSPMLLGAPVAPANVTLCVTPLVLFHVTVPFRAMVTLDGLNDAAPSVTLAVEDGGFGVGLGVGLVTPPPSPPPPHASTAPATIALNAHERMPDFMNCSLCGLPEQDTGAGPQGSWKVGRALDVRDLGLFACCAGTRDAAMLEP